MRSRLLFVAAFLPLLVPAFVTVNRITPDWPAFYAGANLAGTPDLYSFQASQRITRGFMEPAYVWGFVRPPFYAAALAPMRFLRPWTAFGLWQLVGLAAVVAFVLILWRDPLAAIIVAIFPPLGAALKQGQDMPLALLCCGVSLALLHRGAHFWAGAALSVMSIKPHFLLLVPILLVTRKMVGFAAGFATGSAALLAVSFAVGGRGWPAAYVAHIAENERRLEASPAVTEPGSFILAVPEFWWVLLVATAAAALCYFACQKLDTAAALAVCLALGPAVAPRWYLYDFALTLPALLIGLRWWLQGRIASPLAGAAPPGRGVCCRPHAPTWETPPPHPSSRAR